MILPIVVLPTVATTIVSVSGLRDTLRELEVALLNEKLERTMNRAGEAVETLRSAGIEDVEYYVGQQQERLIQTVRDTIIEDGFIFVMKPSGEVVYHPDILPVRGRINHPDSELTRAISEKSRDAITYRIYADGVSAEPRIAVFDQFEPWDWVFVASVDEAALFGSIDSLLTVSLIAAVVAILITISVLLAIARSVARPVRTLTEATERVGAGNLDTRVNEGGAGEFGELSRFFNDMIGRLERYAKELETMVEERTAQLQQVNAELMSRNDDLEVANTLIAEKNRHIGESIQFARRTQRSMISTEADLRSHLEGSFLIYEPKDQLSGDFCWGAETRNGYLVCLGDCMGHGVPGALVTTIAITQLRRTVRDEGLNDPGEILNRMHEHLVSSPDDIGGIDMSILLIGENGGSCCASAHRPIYTVVMDEIKVFEGCRYAVGTRRGITKPVYTSVPLIDRTLSIYLSTDGLEDQPDADGRRFGTTRLTSLLHSIATERIDNQRARIVETLASLVQNRRDDVSILGVKIGDSVGDPGGELNGDIG